MELLDIEFQSSSIYKDVCNWWLFSTVHDFWNSGNKKLGLINCLGRWFVSGKTILNNLVVVYIS